MACPGCGDPHRASRRAAPSCHEGRGKWCEAGFHQGGPHLPERLRMLFLIVNRDFGSARFPRALQHAVLLRRRGIPVAFLALEPRSRISGAPLRCASCCTASGTP